MRPAEIDACDSLARKRRRVDDYSLNTPSPSYLPQQQSQYVPIRSGDHLASCQSALYAAYSTAADGGPSSTLPNPPTVEINEATEDESQIVVEGVDLSQCCFGMVSRRLIPYNGSSYMKLMVGI